MYIFYKHNRVLKIIVVENNSCHGYIETENIQANNMFTYYHKYLIC